MGNAGFISSTVGLRASGIGLVAWGDDGPIGVLGKRNKTQVRGTPRS